MRTIRVVTMHEMRAHWSVPELAKMLGCGKSRIYAMLADDGADIEWSGDFPLGQPVAVSFPRPVDERRYGAVAK